MAEIQTNFSLTGLNSFGISVSAEVYVQVKSVQDVEELVNSPIFQENIHLILGGGSNMLFTKDYPGLVIHPLFEGLEIIEESGQQIVIRVGSGYVWDDFVQYAIKHQYGGIENLSGIPGHVGASPIQNIGAYGMEVSTAIEKVEGYDFQKKAWIEYSNAACDFSYRNSIFKQAHRNTFLVSRVSFRLSRGSHEYVTQYGPVQEKLGKRKLSLAMMREVILEIRNSRLPNVKELGNAGSFFKNPVVDSHISHTLKQAYPDLPVYPVETGKEKLSAAWLIDKAGLKGYRQGNAATHDRQALVLVNLGKARGQEILELANTIQDTVKKRFGVVLEPEVNII